MHDPNIHLSEAARAFAEAKARQKGLDGPDGYVESLVEWAIRRDDRQQRREALLIAGIKSGPGRPVDDQFWEEMRQRVRDRLLTRKES